LASDKLGYLVLMGNRVCRRSGKDAHVYQITDRGVEHLRKVGLLGAKALLNVSPVAPAEAVCVDSAAMRVGLLQAMRGALK
jgi:hypothetical protein